MATINLTVDFGFTAGAASHTASYARIDNTLSPVFTTVTGIITSPATIAENIPNGQYQINFTPVYPDGRTCQPTTIYTPQCQGLISINAYIDGSNIIVQYLAPSEVPKVRITVNYPNGGSYTANYVNNGNDIPIALPANLNGDFAVFGQSVCDEDSSFFSPISSQVVVTRNVDNLTITNTATGLTINDIIGISGYTFTSFVTTGSSTTGSHDAFFGAIDVYFQGIPSNQSAVLKLNGTTIQCVNLTSGFPATFSAASFSSTDNITIELINGVCP
jgi:hypothetical protein